jgi:hypothetical protein
MDESATAPKAMSAHETLVRPGLRLVTPKSGADVCREKARKCRKHAVHGNDLDQCAALVALADRWDALAAEMDREGVSAAKLRRSN